MSLYNIPFYHGLLRKTLFDNKKTTYAHVLVYGAIEIHSSGKLGCIASNKTIGEETGMAPGTVANAISDLNKAGWIKVVMRNAATRSEIIPLLKIAIPSEKNLPEVSLYDESASLENETRFTVQLNPLHSTMNIDNNINNSLDNSIDKPKPKPTRKARSTPLELNHPNEVNNLLLKFYAKILPGVSPRFSPLNRKTLDTLLGVYSEAQISEMIDKYARIRAKPYAPQVDSIEKFATKFVTIQNYKDADSVVTASKFVKPKIDPNIKFGDDIDNF